ncbi:MAG: VanZ family protein [Candidatus Acidiferrales bacterium]
MTDAKLHRRGAPGQTSWSNRVVLLSLAGILFLTLYPFQFAHAESARYLFPFSLNGWGKGGSILDGFLNILLFVPFGFGVGEKLRERGRSKAFTFFVVWAIGALLSYSVEFLQIYIPSRDSGWGDVITNSSGAAVGALMFDYMGAGIIAWFSTRERALESSLSLAKIGVWLFLYIAFWCVLAGPLQKQTKVVNWTRDSFLVLGNSASLRPAAPWKGKISELDIWNRAIPDQLAKKLTAAPGKTDPGWAPLIDYKFSGSAPFRDSRQFLPSLDWITQAPSPEKTGAEFDGHSWLITAGPVPTLVSSVETTGHFALRLICESAEGPESDARIVSLSSPTGSVNMELEQYGSALAFWFRDPFSMRRLRMTWIVPRVFVREQTRDLLLSFNGTALSLFINGRDYGHPYEFGPGVALAHYIRRVKAAELTGYGYIFYAMIFFPAGCLLGFAWRKSGMRWVGWTCFLAAAYLLPAFVIEWVLADAAAHALSFGNVWFCVVLTLAASAWINADRLSAHVLDGEPEPVSVR